MKTTSGILLVILAYTTIMPAQQPQITRFDPVGDFTWTNAETNVYCGVEVSWNLNYTWLAMGFEPATWNVLVTQQVSSAHSSSLTSLWAQVQALGQVLSDPPQGMFFRIVSSPEPLGAQSVTNGLHVVNASTSLISNLTFGLKHYGGYNSITNIGQLAQTETSQTCQVYGDWNPGGGSIAPMVSMTPVQEGWYVSYDHGGSTRVVEGNVIPFGPPERGLLLTVSNAAVTIKPEWLRFSWVLNY